MSDTTPLARTFGASPPGIESYAPGTPVIQPERILRIQGYSDLERVRPAILRSAESVASLAPQLSAPRVAHCSARIVALGDDELELDAGVRLHCPAFARTLAGCTEAVAFVLTVGPALDARVVELADAGELLDALLLETAGWLCIEDATRQFKVHLRKHALARGCRITSRMGPGYSYRLDGRMCTWPLDEQRSLFRLFGDAPLPVAVMESSAMQPKMSRSGLFGVAPLPAPVREVRRAGAERAILLH